MLLDNYFSMCYSICQLKKIIDLSKRILLQFLSKKNTFSITNDTLLILYLVLTGFCGNFFLGFFGGLGVLWEKKHNMIIIED